MTFWLIAVIPIIVAICAKFFLQWELCWKEFILHIGIGIVVVSIVWVAGSSFTKTDQEILNGAVTSTEVNRFRCPTNTSNPCRNGYSCNCVTICVPTDDKGNQSCTTTCDTCYVYPWEQNWYVETTLGQYEISRIDRQGAKEPPRWTSTNVGDPVSRTNIFTNWLKAAKNTLFRDAKSIAEKYKDILPKYPIHIYDYYRVDRAVVVNEALRNPSQWNVEISEAMAEIGAKKEMNLIFVFVDGVQPDFAYAVRYHWNGFKKNDMVVFVGTQNGVVTWVESLSWSKNPANDIRTREYMSSLVGDNVNTLNPREVITNVKVIAEQHFERRSMDEFEYLKRDIPPPTWLVILSLIVSIGLSVGMSIFFHRTVVFDDRSYYYKSMKRRYK